MTKTRGTVMSRLWVALGWAIFAGLLVGGEFRNSAAADAFPSRPVRVIVPFEPGAAVDVVARMVAGGLAAQSGKPVVVENRPGGLTLIGAELVARSEPDGYTLFLALDDTFTTVPHLSKTLPFDPNKGLVPVTLVGKILMVMVENSAVPANSLPALIEYARANPTALSYGSSGSGSATQLAMEMLKSVTKVNFVHVPYKGIAPALTAAASGEVSLTMTGYGTARGLIEDGKVRPVAIAGPEREPALPNIPSTAELGYPEVDATSWLSVAAPAATPRDIVTQVNDAISRALQSPDTHSQLEARHIVVTNIGPAEFAQRIAQRFRNNGEAVRISGAQRD